MWQYCYMPKTPKPMSTEDALALIRAAAAKPAPVAPVEETPEDTVEEKAPRRKAGRPVGSGRGARPSTVGKTEDELAKRPPSHQPGERRKRMAYKAAVAAGKLHELPLEDYPASKLHPETGLPLVKNPTFSERVRSGGSVFNFGTDQDFLKAKDEHFTSGNGQFPDRAHSHPWAEHDFIDMKNDTVPGYRQDVPKDGSVTPQMRNLLDGELAHHQMNYPDKVFASVYKGGGMFRIYSRDKYCAECHPKNANRTFDAPPTSNFGVSARLV